MSARLSRRRFLAISACALAFAGAGRASLPLLRWSGSAFGTDASILLADLDKRSARDVCAAVEAEIDRLEHVFSLFRRDSQISRLNSTGRLDGPAPELLEVLRLAGVVHRSTAGAFDPTIQPLWALHAAAAADGRHPDDAEIAAAERTGWRHLVASPEQIAFARDGMAITLNGIVQGYAADRVAALLRSRDMTDVLVDLGEVNAIGTRPDGQPWRAEIVLPDGAPVRRVTLANRALATSAPFGTVLDPAGRVPHIVDPRTGRPGGAWRLVSVSATNAALADALSTAFCLMPQDAIDRALAKHRDARLEALV